MARITNLKLLSVPLRPDYKHTLYFEDSTAQMNYFESKVRKNYEDMTYQRKDNIVRLDVSIDYLRYWNINYIMYRNLDDDDLATYKWYFAFITETTFVNEGRTDVKIETDCIQTWLFTYVVKPSFIDREHVIDDTIGKNIVEEGLQLSEYICNAHNISGFAGNETSELYSTLWDSTIIVGVTEIYNGNGDYEAAGGTMYNGIYSGVEYYAFENDLTSDKGINTLDAFLKRYAKDGKSDAIVCMFLAPKELANADRDDQRVPGGNTPKTFNINGVSGTANNHLIGLTTNLLDGYEPKNKKLLTYPYRYLLVGNNNGASIVYNYEDFYTRSGNTLTMNPPTFRIEGALTPGCSIRMVPMDYKGATRNDEEGINMGKYPILNWNSDVYTNWLTQNGLNIGISVASSLLQIAGGVAASSTGVGSLMGASAITSGSLGIASTLGEVHKQSMIPPQSEGNINCGDITTSTGRNDFHFYDMTIKRQSAEIIDDYFNMYGYKINRVKTPNVNHRKSYWYTKTIDANIIAGDNGGVEHNDLDKIREAYNNGITFWKNETVFLDYSSDNSITV